MRRATWIVVVLLVVSRASPGLEQGQAKPDSLLVPPGVLDTDTATVVGTEPFERISAAAVDTSSQAVHPSKSPTLALVLSGILPGAGQVYNESYWKVPIVLGFGVYLVSQWLDQNRRYVESRDKYTGSLKINPNGDALELQRREFYRDQRDTFTWYLLILYLVNMADAYVDASLYDFDVGENLSVRLLPGPMPGMKVRISF